MKYKLICCDVFCREIYQALLESNKYVIPFFTMKMSHEYPDYLRETIQKEIDNTDTHVFNYILLGYGLCGNAIAGIRSRKISLVIPRAHDCCTLLLGSKDAYKRHFGHRPSCRWTSGGYMQDGDNYLRNSEIHRFLGTNVNYQDLVKKYGEENARYIAETIKPKDGSDNHVVYIQTQPYERFDARMRAEKEAKSNKQEFELIYGDHRLLQMLVNGDWNEDEFLIVPPSHIIEGIYDDKNVMRAVPYDNQTDADY